MASQPMQPIEIDDHGTARFKANKVVRHLLVHGGISLNDLAMVEFTCEDQEQFAQLIGYSVGGFGELSYVREETYCADLKMLDGCADERDARILALQGQIK